jgi:hypothetical protein
MSMSQSTICNARSASIPLCSRRPPPSSKTITPNGCFDDPRVNFAISTQGREPGLDHLGIQVEDRNELQEVYNRLNKAGGTIIDQGETRCCYASSEKSWIDDPSGIAWETFLTTGDRADYGDGTGERQARIAHAKSCCVPEAVTTKSGCCTEEVVASGCCAE